MARKMTYIPSRTGQMFHDAPVGSYLYKAIRGVPGSGKSIACWWDMRYKAEMQPPFFDAATNKKVRWSRWGVFRRTFQALNKTTIKDGLDWFPENDVIKMHWSPPISGVLELPSAHNDGTWVRMELMFFATDANNFMSDLDSLSLSGAYFNEAADIDWECIHKVQERVGRFKPPGASAQGGWKGLSFGVIMDTNTPNDSSWWYQLEQIEKPDRMIWFIQPQAFIRTTETPPAECKFTKYNGAYYVRNDKAGCRHYGTSGPCENVENLQEGWDYYEKQLVGASEDYIKTRLLNEYGKLKLGEPVWKDYIDSVHSTDEEMPHERGTVTIVGMDTGGSPAAVFMQRTRMGQIRVLGEEYAYGSMVPPFVDRQLIPRLQKDFNWPMTPAIVFADPAGASRSGDMALITAYQYLESKGLRVGMLDLKNNDVTVRTTTVGDLFRQIYQYPPGSGKMMPTFLMSRKGCPHLREALNGGYCMETVTLPDGSKMPGDKPNKRSKYSHIADALQYGAVGMVGGGGGGYAEVGRAAISSAPPPPTQLCFGCE